MTSNRNKKFSLAALIIFSALTLAGSGCRSQSTGPIDSNSELIVWGLWHESDHIKPIIDSFKETTGVTVEYRKLASVAEYEKKLLAALAEGRGPDIFVIHHTWIDSKMGIMSPAPTDVIDERALREEFVDVVAEDLVREGQIYALPTSVDTLALYYNKDLLSASGVARPPQTWTEFQQVIERLTHISGFGTILQSGAAIGTAANINRAADIAQLLFLQSGLSITDDKQQVSFTDDEAARSLTFYTDFANKSKEVYTWDLQQNHSIDAFVEGETAIMLNYSYHLPTVRAKNPRLRYEVAPMPQIEGSTKVNFAAYWPFAVSAGSPAKPTAWAFLRHLTTTEQALTLNQDAGTPPARRDAVIALQRDPIIGVFADQALSAVTWPRADVVANDAIFTTMIDSVVTGAATITEALKRAEDQLNQVQSEVFGKDQEANQPPADNPGAPSINIL